MTVFWPLWYRSYRMRIKEIIDTDTLAAKNLLDTVTAEHDTSTDIDESSHLHHAQDHLNAYQDSNQITQKDATITALDEQ